MSPKHSRTRSTLVVATAAVAVGVAAAPASAAPVEVGTGSTVLTLTRSTVETLDRAGIRATPTGVAAAKGAKIAFPVRGGSIDPATAAATLNHAGGLRLRKGDRQVRLADFRVRVGTRSTLSATVNGGRSRVALFSLGTGRAKVKTAGVQTTVLRLRVQLTSAGATALNATFRTHAFRSRQLIATAGTSVFPADLPLRGGNTALTLDAGTARALTGLGIAVTPSPGATARPDGSIAFPISGGGVAFPSLAGTIDHTGGLTLTAGPKAVTLRDFRITFDGSPTLSADVGGQRIEVLKLDGEKALIKITGRQLIVAGTKASLTQAAATALNQAFGTGALKEGLALGTASVHGRIG